MKSVHPCLQAAVIGIHILNMENLFHDANARLHIHRLEWHIQFPCHPYINGAAICTKHTVLGENRLDNFPNFFAVDLLQDGICGLAAPVPANQHWNLFIG